MSCDYLSASYLSYLYSFKQKKLFWLFDIFLIFSAFIVLAWNSANCIKRPMHYFTRVKIETRCILQCELKGRAVLHLSVKEGEIEEIDGTRQDKQGRGQTRIITIQR